MERRALLATFFVTNTDDFGDGSLRQAILDANATPNAPPDEPDVILFDIPFFDPGFDPATFTWTIAVQSALPTITDPVFIEGRSQAPDVSRPTIVLDGSLAGPDVDGLTIVAGDSIVTALVIQQFDGSGVVLDVAGNNVLFGNYIGTTADGSGDAGNGAFGVLILSGQNVIQSNVISGNFFSGVALSGAAATGNRLIGNRIGTDATGTDPVPNFSGVTLFDATGNTIGGTTAAERNVISGNDDTGVRAVGPGASGNLIAGNYIGTDATGLRQLGNFSNGITLDDAPANTVGGTAAGARNVIADNFNGVLIRGANAVGNLVAGNLIGTDVTGIVGLGNRGGGLFISGAPGNTIGGTTIAARNIIAANAFGLLILDQGASGNVVLGNYVGTDATGTDALPNLGNGIEVTDSPGNTIGGSANGAGNVVSANRGNGVAIFGTASVGNVIQGNLIGTDATGTTRLGNTADGVFLADARDTTVGGTVARARNVISGNSAQGLELNGASGTVVQGNFIGTDISGSLRLRNSRDGILLTDSPNNLIGGVVSRDLRDPVTFEAPPDQLGLRIPPVGNGGTGNPANDTTRSVITVSGLPANDVIADVKVLLSLTYTPVVNLRIVLTAPDGTRVLLADAAGGFGSDYFNTLFDDEASQPISEGFAPFFGAFRPDTPLLNLNGSQPNGDWVLEITVLAPGAPGTLDDFALIIQTADGQTFSEPGNLISGNGNRGVEINDAASRGNLVQGNLIGTDISGSRALGNGSHGVILFGAADNTFGGTAAGAGNVISGNGESGLSINDNPTGRATGIQVLGNFIGTSRDGFSAVPNLLDGIEAFGTSFLTIGGTEDGARNLISGNRRHGIRLIGAQDNLIAGNFIGTDVEGDFALGNSSNGIYLTGGSSQITIGGVAAGAGNVISGNGTPQDGSGVRIDGGSTRNLILGNFIGSDLLGRFSVGNAFHGVYILDSGGNTVGGATAAARNIISGNAQDGVQIIGSDANGNQVAGNFIGTDASGRGFLGNSLRGVAIFDAPGNTVGGATSGERNVISGNSAQGVAIFGTQASGNLVAGNYVGSDVNGVATVANGAGGIQVFRGTANTIGAANVLGADGRSIQSLRGNLVSGNIGDGILLIGSPDGTDPGSLVIGNIIGLDVTGAKALGNTRSGITLSDSSRNTIGGDRPELGNIIGQNFINGIEIGGSDTTRGFPSTSSGNLITGNIIGLDVTGTKDRGNLNHGVLVIGGDHNTIGGANVLNADGSISRRRGNVISDNAGTGIQVQFAAGMVIQGNYIGTDITGNVGLGNSQGGISVTLSSINNTIGGSGIGQGNLVSGNVGNGISLIRNFNPSTDRGLTGNVIWNNRIGTNFDGTRALGNTGNGVQIGNAPDNFVVGNLISGNALNGVNVSTASNHTPRAVARGNQISDNLIGTDASGANALGNTGSGILVDNSPMNTVERNTIAANFGSGVQLINVDAQKNILRGNRIGLAGGSRLLGNRGDGVSLINAGANTIGGIAGSDRNVISANRGNGILISGGTASGNLLLNNLIGTDTTGTAAFGNELAGVLIADAPGNIVGAPNVLNPDGSLGSLRGNVISANGTAGVMIVGASNGATVIGNLIGLDVAGLTPLGNRGDGVMISGTAGVTVGGDAAARNVISANGSDGIEVLNVRRVGQAGPPLATIAGNFIGTDVSGAGSSAGDRLFGNLRDGVFLNASQDVRVGPFNVLSGNGAAGVEIFGRDAATNAPIVDAGNEVVGNVIGTDLNARVALPNANGVQITDTSGNRVGSLRDGSVMPNIISGNTSAGVLITGAVDQGNTVQGNRIGTDLGGSLPIGNLIGVSIAGASNNLIGGDRPDQANLISGNDLAGVLIAGGGRGNRILGNRIGTNAEGTAAVTLGPGFSTQTLQDSGVLIDSSPLNFVGLPGAGNLLSGNLVGVSIVGLNSFESLNGQPVRTGNFVLANRIGTTADGMRRLPNLFGVYLSSTTLNAIGGSGPGEGNLISGNESVGIELLSPLATGNDIVGNLIGTDATGNGRLANRNGIYIEGARPLNLPFQPDPTSPNTEFIPVSNQITNNVISFNTDVGVYIFNNATGNVVRNNVIRNNGAYGIFLYNSAGNSTDANRRGNVMGGNGLADFREFTGPVLPRMPAGGGTAAGGRARRGPGRVAAAVAIADAPPVTTGVRHPRGPRARA